jgi:hypothetical protein
MFGGLTLPDPAFGVPDDEMACCVVRFAVANVLGDRGIVWLSRWCGRRGPAVRRGDASTVTGGKVAAFAEDAGIAAGSSEVATAWSACADASAGINPDNSASLRHLFDTPTASATFKRRSIGHQSAMVVVRFTTAV